MAHKSDYTDSGVVKEALHAIAAVARRKGAAKLLASLAPKADMSSSTPQKQDAGKAPESPSPMATDKPGLMLLMGRLKRPSKPEASRSHKNDSDSY